MIVTEAGTGRPTRVTTTSVPYRKGLESFTSSARFLTEFRRSPA
jgi:hypothetical protein